MSVKINPEDDPESPEYRDALHKNCKNSEAQLERQKNVEIQENQKLNLENGHLKRLTIKQAHSITKLELRLDACLYSMVMMQSLLKCYEDNNKNNEQYIKDKNTAEWKIVKLAT